jgi:hypothetical protein
MKKLAVILLCILFVFACFACELGSNNDGEKGFGTVTSSNHSPNERVVTDWFALTMTGGFIDPPGVGFGDVDAPPEGWRLVRIKLILENFTDEDCEMEIFDDFLVETGGKTYGMQNKGGDFETTTLNPHGLFYNYFIIPPGESLYGWVVFYVQATPGADGRIRFTFVYEEWHFSGDDRVAPKHHYKFPLMTAVLT